MKEKTVLINSQTPLKLSRLSRILAPILQNGPTTRTQKYIFDLSRGPCHTHAYYHKATLNLQQQRPTQVFFKKAGVKSIPHESSLYSMIPSLKSAKQCHSPSLRAQHDFKSGSLSTKSNPRLDQPFAPRLAWGKCIYARPRFFACRVHSISASRYVHTFRLSDFS